MTASVNCFGCGTLLGYAYDSAPRGIINCENCHSKELLHEAEKAEEDADD